MDPRCVDMERRVDKLDGSGANPRDHSRVGLLSAWCHAHLAPSAATYLRAELWPVSCLSQERRLSLTVQRLSEAWNVDRNGAARKPHAHVWRRVYKCFRDIGDEAHVDSVTKCEAHLSKSEQAKLDEAGRLTTAGNAWADELAKEGARDHSFQSTLYDTCKAAVEASKAIIGYIGNLILRAKGGERGPDVVTPPQGWDEKEERWKRAAPILVLPHGLRRRGRGKHAGDGAEKAKLARTEWVETGTGRTRFAIRSLLAQAILAQGFVSCLLFGCPCRSHDFCFHRCSLSLGGVLRCWFDEAYEGPCFSVITGFPATMRYWRSLISCDSNIRNY